MAAGNPDGISKLTIHEAAYVALADLDALYTQASPYVLGMEGRKLLMEKLTESSSADAMAPVRAVNPEAEIAAMKAEMAARAAAKKAREGGEVGS